MEYIMHNKNREKAPAQYVRNIMQVKVLSTWHREGSLHVLWQHKKFCVCLAANCYKRAT